jgi:uncharacterized membrane protein (UPF0127 family)
MLRSGLASLIVGLACAGSACAEEAAQPIAAPGHSPRSLWLALGGETFTLELAADPATRYRGLSGRTSIGRNAGMLFVYPGSAPRAMVMRDCPVPIDVAFLDAEGRIVALSEMKPAPPRASHEARSAYEARLPVHHSGAPARFAIELAGGRLAALGLRVGDEIVLDTAALVSLAR